MDNSKNESKVNENPKPTDQLQMEIETVTPDTEKDVVPTVENDKSPKDELKEETDQMEDGNSPKASNQTAEVETVVPDKAKAENIVTPVEENGDAEIAAVQSEGNDIVHSNEETKTEDEEVKDTNNNQTEEEETGNSDEVGQKNEDDERDQIETVSP